MHTELAMSTVRPKRPFSGVFFNTMVNSLPAASASFFAASAAGGSLVNTCFGFSFAASTAAGADAPTTSSFKASVVILAIFVSGTFCSELSFPQQHFVLLPPMFLSTQQLVTLLRDD